MKNTHTLQLYINIKPENCRPATATRESYGGYEFWIYPESVYFGAAKIYFRMGLMKRLIWMWEYGFRVIWKLQDSDIEYNFFYTHFTKTARDLYLWNIEKKWSFMGTFLLLLLSSNSMYAGVHTCEIATKITYSSMSGRFVDIMVQNGMTSALIKWDYFLFL